MGWIGVSPNTCLGLFTKQPFWTRDTGRIETLYIHTNIYHILLLLEKIFFHVM